MSRIRVIVAEDQEDVREVLADLVSGDASLELIGTAADADEAVALAGKHRPDVALLDVKMPGGGGAHAAEEIARVSPGTKIVALSAYEDRSTVLEMLRAGAIGYLVKGASVQEVLDAIHRSVRGEGVLSVEVTGDVVRELATELDRKRRVSVEREDAISRIRQATANGSLESRYQPIAELATGRISGVEALARFHTDPPRPPDVWFSEAASVGLDVELDVAALRSALTGFDALPGGVFLSVNLTPRGVTSPEVLDVLGGSDLARLVVEVTEHVAVEDYEALNDALGPLRKRGLRLAIDDAGAGFASLRHILLTAPDLIKIDLSITRDVDSDPARRSLASALVRFARDVGAEVVAEGIETAEEATVLRDLGVRFGQGYFLARPGSLPYESPYVRVPALI